MTNTREKSVTLIVDGAETVSKSSEQTLYNSSLYYGEGYRIKLECKGMNDEHYYCHYYVSLCL